MARPKKLENMTRFELAELHNRVMKAKEEKRKEEAGKLREAITAMAKQHGFKVRDLIR